MKRLLVIIASVFALMSCQKDEVITPALEYNNVYAIIDNPDDSVQHRTYNIYKEFGVPVYFNDTIGRVYIMDDVLGNPIYNYEMLDLAWRYNAYDKDTYQFDYMTDDKQKMMALDIIEAYLNDVSPALRPFSFFVTKETRKYNQGVLNSTIRNSAFNIGYRTILMTGNWTAQQYESQPALMKRQMVINKVANFVDEVAEFSAVSKSTWYGGIAWERIYDFSKIQLVERWTDDMQMLYDDWAGAVWYTAAELEQMRKNARTVAGSFGFIKGNHSTKGLETPSNASYDLQDYVTEALRLSPEEFEEIWGTSPLVMKKYGIIRSIIEDKLFVKL